MRCACSFMYAYVFVYVLTAGQWFSFWPITRIESTSKCGKQTFYKILNFQTHKTNYEIESRETEEKKRTHNCTQHIVHKANTPP